jgi:hypothetical protein
MNEFSKYVVDNYSDEAENIANYGINSGYGPIYYTQQLEIWDKFQDEIFELDQDWQEENGFSFIADALKECNGSCLHFKCRSVQFAIEVVCARTLAESEV